MKRANTDFIVVHCSATPPSMDIGVAEIRRWHTDRGWQDIGYHLVIRRDGTVETGRQIDQQGAHVHGHNHNSIGICMVGGVSTTGKPQNNFTAQQFESLGQWLDALSSKYPTAEIKGHRDFPEVAKACPSFDVREWWKKRTAHQTT